jgi:hypothetical protein
VPIIASASSSSISFISTAITATRKGPYKNYGLIQPENSGKWTRRLGGIGMYEGGKAARSLCRHVHALRCGGMRVTIGGKCLRLDAVVSTRQQLDVLHATKSIDISDELFSCQTSTATLKEPLGPGTSRTVNDSNNLQSNESIDPGTLARRCDCLSAATPGRRSKWFFTEQIVALRTLFHLSTLSSEAYSWILRFVI